MGEQTHRIRRQILEIEIADERDARPLQERLSRLHRQRIAAAIERACDAIAGSGALLRLDRVTVDLGEIAADELEEVLVERLRGRLEGSLRRVAQGEERGSGGGVTGGFRSDARRVDDSRAAIEELAIFARTGALPWWASDRDGDHLQRRAEALEVSAPGALVRLVRGLVSAGERRSVARLVAQLDDRLLGELVGRSLAPARLRTLDGAGGPVAAAAELAAILGAPEAIAEYTPRARRNLAWRGLLWVAGSGKGGGGASALPTSELYGMVLEAVAEIVGRPLPGAARRLRARVHSGEAAAGEGAAVVERDGTAALRRTGAEADAGASTRLSKRSGSTPSSDGRGEQREAAAEPAARGEVAREAMRRLAERAARSQASASGRDEAPAEVRRGGAQVEADAPASSKPRDVLVSSDMSIPARRGAVEAIEAWVTAAEDAVAVVGAGPPGIEGRRRLDRLIAALVALAPRVAEWSEAELGGRLLAVVDPTMSSRRGVEFSLMALVGGAASRLAPAEVKALRRGLEALLVRARAREAKAAEDVPHEPAAASPTHSPGASMDPQASPARSTDKREDDRRGASRERGAVEPGSRDASRVGAVGEGGSAAHQAAGLDSESADRRQAQARDPSPSAPRSRARADDSVEVASADPRSRGAFARRRGPQRSAQELGPSRAGPTSAGPARSGSTPADASARQRKDARARADAAPRRRPPPSLPSLADLQEEALYIDDAGMVLLWPFIPFFLRHLGLVEERSFVDAAARQRAAALLRVAVSGEREVAEYQLPLAKVLCGLELDALFELDTPVSDEEDAEATAMLEAVIARAPVLRRMSVAGLRGSFLLRPGALRVRDGAWLLQVERQSFDVILDRFPWSTSWVKLPWMDEPVQVEW